MRTPLSGFEGVNQISATDEVSEGGGHQMRRERTRLASVKTSYLQSRFALVDSLDSDIQAGDATLASWERVRDLCLCRSASRLDREAV